MKRKLLITSAIACLALAIFAVAFVFVGRGPELIGENEENEMYDGPGLAMAQEVEKTKDITLGYVPSERLVPAMQQAADSKAQVQREMTPSGRLGAKAGKRETISDSPSSPQVLSWVERGSNSDSLGPSNGNFRGPTQTGPVTSGRIRAILVDAADATGKTVFVGGVDGGLWKTTDITASPATWTVVNDGLSSLAISDIAQNPANPSIMYFATGEGYFNGDAVGGNGLFKSVDGGATWNQLPATTKMSINRVLVDAAGNVYIGGAASPALGNAAAGVQRSTDGGGVFTPITPTGSSTRIADMELSSTGRLHIATGLGNSSIGQYRYTDTPATVTSATWTTAATPFPYPSGNNCRVELAVSGNTVYALPSNTSAQVATIYKSTDGGQTWAATTTQPTAGWASGQAWYALNVVINPANPLEVIIGGLDAWRTLDGGLTWVHISAWTTFCSGCNLLPYVHADQHEGVWYDGGNKLLIGTDGGIFYSTDKGITFNDRNVGLRLKQFYSVAIHPTLTNYFLAGAQDNGTHQLNNAGLSGSVEVTGGDGAFVAIDQDNPANQFGAYVFNRYRFSTNSGATWASKDFIPGGVDVGMFINPFELDSAADIVYGSNNSGSMTRWPTAPTGTPVTVPVTNLVGQISSLAVSPYTANRLLVGTSSGTIFRIDNANTGSPVTATSISTGLQAGTYISNVAFGTNDNNLIASVSNYGANHVLVSTDGGANWTNISGNLPDMPVRWAIFKAGTNSAAFIATEAGVWETAAIAGAATVWVADPTFPTVRVDMLRYRPSDGLIAAATHGRGIWTTAVPTAANVTISGRVFGSADGRGLTNAKVVLTGQDGSSRVAITGRLGSYRFDDVPAGATYTVSVNSRRFTFTPQAITVSDSIGDLNFYPTGSRFER